MRIRKAVYGHPEMNTLGTPLNSMGGRDETIAGQRYKRIAKYGDVGTMRVRVAAALLFLGGILYAMLSGNWASGAIAFSLGFVLLGLNRIPLAQRRSDRAVGWVLVLCAALTVMFFAIGLALDV